MLSSLSWHFGGPIAWHEILRWTRRRAPRFVRALLIMMLFGQICMVLPNSLGDSDPVPKLVTSPGRRTSTAVERERMQIERRAEIADFYLSMLLFELLVATIFFTPALCAGAIAFEKERDTLQALFGTQLTSFQIVSGKLLGRLAHLLHLGALLVPIVVFLDSFGNLDWWRVVIALLQTAVIAFALCCASLLASVWARRTSDAIMTCYAMMAIAYIVLDQAMSRLRITLDELNPFVVSRNLLDMKFHMPAHVLPVHLAGWACLGVIFLLLTLALLRRAALRQLEGNAKSWFWLKRPVLGDDPVYWRERHIIGMAPLPQLRKVPTWIALFSVFVVSGALAFEGLRAVLGVGWYLAIRDGDLGRALAVSWRPYVNKLWPELTIMGMFLIMVASVAVAARCAGSIAEEKRRKTWEDLLLTPLRLDEIVQGKLWGVVFATRPYLIAYALPMLFLAAFGGSFGVTVALLWLGGAWLAILVAAFVGMSISEPTQSGGWYKPGEIDRSMKLSPNR